MSITTIKKKVEDTCKPASTPAAPVLGSSTKVVCKCPEDRLLEYCFTTVNSTANMHTVICNNMTTTNIHCGSELYGRDMGILGVPLTKYNHPLCSTFAYLAVQTDLEWSCEDPSVSVPASSSCSYAIIAASSAATTDHKSSKRAKTKPVKRLSGKQTVNFEFSSCDYVDLVEVGHRKQSDYNCSMGDKFVLKVLIFVWLECHHICIVRL